MNIILIRFRELIRGKGKKNVTEIKYFSPTEQKTIPNGSYYQRGGFVTECMKNTIDYVKYNIFSPCRYM